MKKINLFLADLFFIFGILTLFSVSSAAAKEEHYFTYETHSLSAAADNLGLTIYDEDKIHTFPDPKLGLGGKLFIDRAPSLKVIDANKETVHRSWQKNLADFLAEKKIELGVNDKITPSLNNEIKDNETIKIVRVAITEIKQKEKISYQIIEQNEAGIEKGKTIIKEPGEQGLREKIFRVTRENSKEVKRELVSDKIIKEPKNRLIVHGTKEVVLGEGKATWYDWIRGNTAAHNTLPFGTMVRVTNLKNNKSVVVKIIDHGIRGGAVIDLAKDAFTQIGSLREGIIPVKITKE